MAIPGWFIAGLSVWQFLDMLEKFFRYFRAFYFNEK
jgi:hypothetical protein